jgi:hypothetical protein
MKLKTGDRFPVVDGVSGLSGRLLAESALGRWIEDLARILNGDCAASDIAMCGRAVIIQHDDEEDAFNLIRSAAIAAGFRFEILRDDDARTVFEHGGEVFEPTLLWIPRRFWEKGDVEGNAEIEYGDELDWLDAPLHPAYRAMNQAIDASCADRFVVMVTTPERLSQIPVAMRRTGRFDRRLTLPVFTDSAIGQDFIDQLGERWVSSELKEIPERVGAIVRMEFQDARRRELLRIALRRRAWRERRSVNLSDVVEYTVYGTADEDRKQPMADEVERTAIHEAGHIVVAWLDSVEQRPPVYASVTERNGTLGMVVAAHDSIERASRDNTRRDLDHFIRLSLAGRAAEVLVLGGDRVSASGAANDLERASNLAWTMFAEYGLPTATGDDADPAANLAVFVEGSAPEERLRVAEVVRLYLARQFETVTGLLKANIILLNRLTEALREQGVMFQEDIERVGREAARETWRKAG